MFRMVQLEDGCYFVTVDYSCAGVSLHREWTFRRAESNAKPLDGGEYIQLEFAQPELTEK